MVVGPPRRLRRGARRPRVGTGVDAAIVDQIHGAERTAPGHEGPAGRVAQGGADAGPGLRSTAEKLDLEFRSLGHQPVEVRANPDRVEEPGVEDMAAVLAGPSEYVDDCPGGSWNR